MREILKTSGNNILTRLNFFQVTGLASAAILIPAAVYSIEKSVCLDWLDHPENWNISPIRPVPPELQGTYVNSPTIYSRDATVINRFLPMLKSWIKGVRIILNDSLETDLGKYRDSVLEQLVSFAGKLDAMGKKIQVDLFDGYTMRDTSDPVYGKNDASSPYAKDGYTAFYTQDEYKEALINRIKHIAPVLNSIPNLTTVGIANELVYPPGDVGEELFAEWYRTMIPETVKALPDIPILSGAADPRMLPDKMTGLTAKSINLYPLTFRLFGLADYMAASDVPVIIRECGIPDEIYGIRIPAEQDRLLAGYLREIIYHTTWVNPTTYEVKLGFCQMDTWKLDYYIDHYLYFPETFHRTNDILVKISQATTKTS